MFLIPQWLHNTTWSEEAAGCKQAYRNMWTACLNPLWVHQARCIKETQRKTTEIHKKRKFQQSKPQTVTGHGNSGCARSAVLNTYHWINWTSREGRAHPSKLCCWADQNTTLHVWSSQQRPQEVLNVYIPQKKSSSFGLCDKKPQFLQLPSSPD